MGYVIKGLAPDNFTPLFDFDESALAARDMVRVTATSKPGYPCRVSLLDAEPGEDLVLLHHESHNAATPYRSAYAIYVRENAHEAAIFENTIPPVLKGRPIALRLFGKDGMLRGADLVLDGRCEAAIERAFADEEIAYIHAHNAAHGCFAAQIDRL